MTGRPTQRTGLIVVLSALAGLIVGPGAEAAGRFDGKWAIFIYGPPGKCAIGYRLPLHISGQTILYRGREVSPRAISVTATGMVNIRLGSGRFTVVGVGALEGRKGSGKWVAPSFSCKGLWHAKRLR